MPPLINYQLVLVLIVSVTITVTSNQPIHHSRQAYSTLDNPNTYQGLVAYSGKSNVIDSIKASRQHYGTAANKFECYSCMSTNYQDSWELLESIYVVPKTFTNRCNDPDLQNQERGGRNPMPTTTCSSFCVTLIESNFEGGRQDISLFLLPERLGVFISHKYIRGCAERIVLSGFNQTSIRTHRFNSMDTCRTLPRALIFNQPKGLDTPVYGDVRVCSCFGDGCNGGSNSSPTFKKMPSMNIVSFILILSIFVLNI
uniref:Caenorhabditis elegans ly-6-related family-containing protein n=1 Tax=Rhabditophanes sp. KR3021 TaxID=114890 RepID=A0AC35TW43_9BILA